MTKKAAGFPFQALTDCRRAELQSFAHAWAGMEPTFSNAKAVRKWERMSARPGGEDAWMRDRWMLRKLHEVGHRLLESYERRRERGDSGCIFPDVELDVDRDPWDVERVNLRFSTGRARDPEFEVRFGLDPETFEYSIKPVPLAWFHDQRFVRFLSEFVWRVPRKLGLVASMAHGGGQFSFSAKTYLQGSLLADDIADRLNHPELATWINDYPNADARSFRATNERCAAFVRVIEQYWAGAFHPDAIGVLRVHNALLDRGFDPAHAPPAGLMDAARGAQGDPPTVFQTNFAFGRAVRKRAQDVTPGYWQSQHPDEDGYRGDQIMRYSEGNLNRLQIAGELHVKSGKVLSVEDVPEFDAPLDLSMLHEEASWEHRGQMSRTSAEDYVEALLLEAHHAEWLSHHPHVTLASSLAQDVILKDGEATLQRRAPERMAELRRSARAANLEASRGRVKSDFVEPETLFWAGWHVLKPGEQAAIAREAILGFVERVERAASVDPRARLAEPMAAHRHRVHPLLWAALPFDAGALAREEVLVHELRRWREDEAHCLQQRPRWSPTGSTPPWE